MTYTAKNPCPPTAFSVPKKKQNFHPAETDPYVDLFNEEVGRLVPYIQIEDIELTKFYNNRSKCSIIKLEGTAAYGCLLLAPAEGWWPSASWRALRALFSFRCLEGLLPIIFI